MSEERTGSLLVDYFKTFLEDQDMEAFRDRVAARYNEGTLGRILAGSPAVAARRAAVVSLGLLGSFEQSNAALGRSLKDSDPAVRGMAEQALWTVWSRADTPENNQLLEQVHNSIRNEQLNQAEAFANRLIQLAPDFAEAYNQRAIIYFHQGRFAESVQDCKQVLRRNPYHFGAISGMAQCQLKLNRPREALKTLRQGLKLQPYSNSIREFIRDLETQIGPDDSR
jgi:tetratricopeptide (TPR) repeat protein